MTLLVNFLKKLKNEQVTLELKNGTTVWGTLQSVSSQMNVTVTDVVLSLPKSQSGKVSGGPGALASVYLVNNAQPDKANNDDGSVSLQYMNIRGNTIRQIILPDSLNLDSLLVDEAQVKRLKKASAKPSETNYRKRRNEFGGNTAKRIKRGV
ncbi:Small nuclear ribonucleoprotein Sm D1 [Nakaseomyces glabratus]|uniref:Small nuclear ribonucleoprotein Sm D1 n=1 Tax=Candida glabrata TaxID=5478 RepID=A0A0W0CAA0_CANGB|nr:Small nuclear ribonucleoprotein Sm D1 [Nakaseomyces glabratus]KTA99774.1 Small nuclear ribonucleoprotein Sm D1 [Nakaseomyces glabratus]KTB09588.1 Small nuclear ribonucleoprotein Sm D1 [Nakaseomyces glabratus]KTB12016.1 Small nuclear ribonucleoprotein Sm D1 [Nakaseomyces glabratus]